MPINMVLLAPPALSWRNSQDAPMSQRIESVIDHSNLHLLKGPAFQCQFAETGPLKLLVDARVGWGSGIGRVTANVVPHLARIRPGWAIDVLVLPRDLDSARHVFDAEPNLSAIACPIDPFSLGEQFRLARYARGYDLVWFVNYWVPLLWRGRFVVTVHDLLHLEPALFPASRLKRFLARLSFAKVRRSAEAVMFDSRFSRREFERKVGKPKLGITVHIGADHGELTSIDPIDSTAKRPLILMVGASKQHKNYELALAAWNRANVGSEWSLAIVSPDGPLLSSIDLAEIARDGRRTQLHRGISDAQLRDLYREASIVLTPSLYEGFGLPLAEAMQAGAMCISSAAEALVEIAENAIVQFVNGRDLPGWVSAIEHCCAMVDRSDPLIEYAVAENRIAVARFKWSAMAELVADTLAAIPLSASKP